MASDGVVYVGTREGKVKALNDDGSGEVNVRWTYPEGEDQQIIGVFNTPVVGDQLVYVSAADGVLYALDKDSGLPEGKGWSRNLVDSDEDLNLVGGPALHEDLKIVLVGSEDNNLYALDSATGEIRWVFGANDKIWSTPAISGGTVYFGSHDKNVYAVDLLTGQEKWRFTTGGAVVARPRIWRNMVIIGSFDRKLYALDVKGGGLQWEFESGNWFWAGAVASSTTVFAPSMDGKVYALDRAGNPLWQEPHSAGSPIVSTPVLVPRGLAVASKEGAISLLDKTQGNSISDLDIGPAEVKAPLFTLPVDQDDLSQTGIQASGDDQRESIFVGDQNGIVRRIQVKSGHVLIWCFDTEKNEMYRERECK